MGRLGMNHLRLADLLLALQRKLENGAAQVAGRLALRGAELQEIAAGQARMPLDRVPEFAAAMGVDVMDLFLACLEAYFPSTYSAIHERLEESLTAHEAEVIKELRRHALSPFLVGLTEEQRLKLNAWLSSLREHPGRPAYMH